jgi:TRAP-type C4-dicarboxylate transport system permease small subunit
MKRLVKWVDFGLSWILIILTVGMVLDVSWQVFTRFIIRDPSSFTEELATFLLIWIGLLGSAYALRQKAHLGIDILTIKMKPETRYIWEFLIYSVVIVFSVLVLIWGGIRLVSITLHMNQISAALRIKMGYVYTVLPITGILMIFYSAYFMVEACSGLKTHRFEQIKHSTIGID